MKKLLLIAVTLGIAASSQAQKRLALYEEFTGENCGPCASTNPGLEALINATGNASKIQMIKYMVPIPAGTTQLYPQAKVYADARATYYSISSAPSGKMDGLTSSPSSASPGHPGYLDQAEIDAAAAVASPFNITVTTSWDATYSNINAKITVNTVSAYAGSGSVYLRTALLETVEYCLSPGNNGETHFPGIVRSMYPDALGTSVAASWAVGTTQTYNFVIPVPQYVDKNAGPKIVVFIQADGDKKIAQSAVSAPLPTPSMANDAKLQCSVSPSCITGTTGTISRTVTIMNKGTAPITSATLYSRSGTSGAYTTTTPWTGTLAAGASTNITLSGISVTAGNTYLFSDSIVLGGDQNAGNDKYNSSVSVFSTAPKALPLSYNWEAAPTGGFLSYDFGKSGEYWLRTNAVISSGSVAHTGNYLGWFQLFALGKGVSAYMVVPTPTITSKAYLEFWEAYTQQTAANNDKLEVVYSKDCGTTWTSLWSKSGSAHATDAPSVVGTGYWLPLDKSDWVLRSINISTLPSGSLLAIRGVSDGGNNMFIDDINIVATPTGIIEETLVNSITLSPNPAKEYTNVTFNLSETTEVNVSVIDAVGKTVLNVSNEKMASGSHQMNISTSSLSSGMYMIKIATSNGIKTEKLSVIK